MLNKKLLVFVILFITALSLSFADDTKLYAPRSGEVMLIGRVSFAKEIDRGFYLKTLNILDEKEKAAAHQYGIIGAGARGASRDAKLIAAVGEYFFVSVQIPKNKNFFLPGFRVCLFGNNFYWLDLPFAMDVKVSKDTKYMYIGSFTYEFVGDNFLVDGVYQADEFDEAQALLNKRLGKNVQLTRAVLLKPEEN